MMMRMGMMVRLDVNSRDRAEPHSSAAPRDSVSSVCQGLQKRPNFERHAAHLCTADKNNTQRGSTQRGSKVL